MSTESKIIQTQSGYYFSISIKVSRRQKPTYQNSKYDDVIEYEGKLSGNTETYSDAERLLANAKDSLIRELNV